LKTTLKRSHCSGNEKNELKQEPAGYNQNTEDDLKILLRILYIQTSQLLLYFIPMTSLYMAGLRLTPSQYAHQKNVETFGYLIFDLPEHRLIHISCIIFQYAILRGIGYEVHQYLSIVLLHFEEFSEDHFFPAEE